MSTPRAFTRLLSTGLLSWVALAGLGTACLGLAACDATLGGTRTRTDAMTEYGAAIRWNEFDTALNFLDPAQAAARPLTDLERERFKQLQVTGYEVKSARDTADGGIEQDVEIRVVNRNTQRERSIIDHQRWRWDAEAKRYLLTSGLPDFSVEPQ
jgi:hypothetical protein